MRKVQVFAAIAAALLVTVSAPALAQKKGAGKETEKKSEAPATPVVRYFTSLNDISEAILKETRTGNKLTAATLDVCFPVDVDSPLKDRFIVDL